MIIVKHFKKNYRRGEFILSENKMKWWNLLKGIIHRNEKFNGVFGYIGIVPSVIYVHDGNLFIAFYQNTFKLTEDIDVLLTNEGNAQAIFYLYENNQVLKKIHYNVRKPFLIDYDFTHIDMSDEDFGTFIYERIKSKKNRFALIQSWS